MKIKTNDGEYNVASQGVGGTALGLGIAGTALGLMNGNGGCGNNGLFGGLFGSNNNNNCCGCVVHEKELNYAAALAQCQSERYSEQIARQEAEKAFLESRRVDDKISAVVKETTDNLIKTGVAVAENAKALECLKIAVERNREEAKSYTDAAISHESQIRTLSDTNLKGYFDKELCKKIDGVLRIDGSQICYDPCPCGKETDPFYVAQAKPAK